MSIRWLLPLGAAVLASFARIGADARWLDAVGRLVAHGHLPGALPFATAPTAGWHDAPALGELVFHGLVSLGGDRMLIVAQVLAAAIGFGALAAGIEERVAGPVGALVALGALPSLLVTRNGLYSLALFPVLLLLLERGRRLWLAVPLIVLWANLYGGVLVGWALLAVYVAVARRRAWPVLALATVGLFATPALWHTADYYRGAISNEAAKLGVGLWSPLGLTLFDVLLVIAAALLVYAAGRQWRPWEAVAALGLAAATVHTARIGVWLLMVAAYPATRGLRMPATTRVPRLAAVVPLIAIVAGITLWSRNDAGSLARRAAATGKPVLADAVAAEQVEALGGRVWVANPIDAFRAADQRVYLKWLDGEPEGRSAVDHAGLVLVLRGSDAAGVAAKDARLTETARTSEYVLYARR